MEKYIRHIYKAGSDTYGNLSDSRESSKLFIQQELRPLEIDRLGKCRNFYIGRDFYKPLYLFFISLNGLPSKLYLGFYGRLICYFTANESTFY